MQLYGREVTDEALKGLAAHKGLTALRLELPNLTDASLKELAALKNLTTLGIEATLRLVDAVQYQRRIDEFDFDLVVRRFSFSSTPGDALRLNFTFRCDLCPQEYTLTAASHDPNGVWHDWLEDAVTFSVTDLRHTTGVANLRAQLGIERITT